MTFLHRIRTLLPAFALLATVLIVAGCGGGGATSTGRAPTQATRDHAQGAIGVFFRSAAIGGGPSGAFAQGQNNPSGDAGFSMMGGFFREMASAGSGGMLRGGSSTGGDPSDGGWNGDTGFYYDEWLGLWVEPQVTTTSYTFLLFEDEAKTIPAGSIVTSYPKDWLVFPLTFSSTYDILAGTMAGSHGSYVLLFESDMTGNAIFSNAYPDGSSDHGDAQWNADGSTSNYRFDGLDGYWNECSSTFNSDGSGTSHSADSRGYAANFVFNADGSGHGTIEGPDPGLPATITWDNQGNVHIRWADGTTEDFNWQWVEDGSDGNSGPGKGGDGQSGPTK